VRRALLHQFPYGIYFLSEREAVVILAVLHSHRNPDVWKSRA
jgi:plasmid stabilization system protein ParE